jgi:hypothetical protein
MGSSSDYRRARLRALLLTPGQDYGVYLVLNTVESLRTTARERSTMTLMYPEYGNHAPAGGLVDSVRLSSGCLLGL